MNDSTAYSSLRWKRTRTLAWIIWASKIMSFLGVWLKAAPPEIKTPYLVLRITDVLVGLPLVLILHHPRLYVWAAWRFALILYTVLAFTIEGILTHRLQAGILAWSPLVVGLGCFFSFDPISEWKKAISGIIAGATLSLVAIGLHPFVHFLPADNPIADNLPRTLLLIAAGAVGYFFVVRQYRDALQQSLDLAEAARAAAAQNEALARGLEAERAELTKTLETLEALQTQEKRRAQREATLAQYEALMRESYTASVPDFLQKLLDRFAEELPMLGGVIYMRCSEGWRVESAYALRQYLGQTHPGGTLTTAANVKAPYLIFPAPAGTAKIRTSVATLTPKAILYLPFYSEATGKTLAVAELLLSAPISEEKEALLEILLPRIGTYLWARQGSLSPTA